MAEQRDKEFYKAKIRELIDEIDNLDFLKKNIFFYKSICRRISGGAVNPAPSCTACQPIG